MGVSTCWAGQGGAAHGAGPLCPPAAHSRSTHHHERGTDHTDVDRHLEAGHEAAALLHGGQLRNVDDGGTKLATHGQTLQGGRRKAGV